MRRNSRLSGEAMWFGIEEGKIVESLQARGFDQIKNVTAKDLHDLYFKGINEKRTLAPVYAIVSATVSHEPKD